MGQSECGWLDLGFRHQWLRRCLPGLRWFGTTLQVAENIEQFLSPNQACDIMPDGVAKDMALNRGQSARPIFDERFGDGCKCIQVIEDERAQFTAPAADVEGFREGHGSGG